MEYRGTIKIITTNTLNSKNSKNAIDNIESCCINAENEYHSPNTSRRINETKTLIINKRGDIKESAKLNVSPPEIINNWLRNIERTNPA